MPRLKLLISAYACSPQEGSESGKGWRVVTHMAAHHDIWVITRANNAGAIENALRQNPIDQLHFEYLDLPAWARFWKRGGRGVELYYYLWQIAAYFRARRMHRTIGFDLVHHYTFAKYWSPSFLSMLPIPFVWGPVGGGESSPESFGSYFGVRGRMYEGLRRAARWLGECDPFVRLTARRSAIAYATTKDSQDRMLRIGARSIEVKAAIALDEADIRQLGSFAEPDASSMRFIFIGRLLGWKGVGLAIQALARACIPGAELWVVGGGPEAASLQRLAQSLGVQEAVKFWGELPRRDALAKLGQSHVLVHPSLHDSGGWVCLEAMAARRPVICLDLGGPGTLVSEDAGIKVAAQCEEQVVQDIAAAMNRLAGDSQLRGRMGQAGRQRVLAHFTWPAKCVEMSQMYFKCLQQGISQASGTA
jgi:glycosyltransferase involved in cell wall biosynthesis